MAKENSKTNPLRRVPKGIIGAYGTDIFSGWLDEEYNSTMNSDTKWSEFDRMANNDVVRVLRLISKLPLVRAKWQVESGGNSDKAEEMKMFIEKELFENINDSWLKRVDAAVEYLFDGFSLFEMVYGTKEYDLGGGNRIYNTWEEWAWRKPSTIKEWYFENQKWVGVRQEGPNPDTWSAKYIDAKIPADKLMLFSANARGANLAGNGIYRAAWQPWKKMELIDQSKIIYHDRISAGIPVAELPEGAGDNVADAVETALESFRAGDTSYLIVPAGVKISFMAGGSNQVDFEKALNAYESRIKYLGLAQFIDLGQTTTGSRSVGEVHFELYLQASQAIANYMAEVINAMAIIPLLEMNYDKNKYGAEYPYLIATGIETSDVEMLSRAFKNFTDGGINLSDMETQQRVREAMDLPLLSEEDMELENKKRESKRKAELEMLKSGAVEQQKRPAPQTPPENDIDEPEDDMCDCGHVHKFASSASVTGPIDARGYMIRLANRRGANIYNMFIKALAGPFDEETKMFAEEQADAEIQRIENSNGQLRDRIGNKATNYYTTFQSKITTSTISGQDPYLIVPPDAATSKTVKSMNMETSEAYREGEADYVKHYENAFGEVEKAFQDPEFIEEINLELNTRLGVGVRRIQDSAKGAQQRAFTLGLKGKEKADYITAQILTLSMDNLTASIKEVINISYGQGRNNKKKELKPKKELYVAVFDRSTCIECAPKDGVVHLSTDTNYIAPNPRCLGRDRCRCVNLPVE